MEMLVDVYVLCLYGTVSDNGSRNATIGIGLFVCGFRCVSNAFFALLGVLVCIYHGNDDIFYTFFTWFRNNTAHRKRTDYFFKLFSLYHAIKNVLLRHNVKIRYRLANNYSCYLKTFDVFL